MQPPGATLKNTVFPFADTALNVACACKGSFSLLAPQRGSALADLATFLVGTPTSRGEVLPLPEYSYSEDEPPIVSSPGHRKSMVLRWTACSEKSTRERSVEPPIGCRVGWRRLAGTHAATAAGGTVAPVR